MLTFCLYLMPALHQADKMATFLLKSETKWVKFHDIIHSGDTMFVYLGTFFINAQKRKTSSIYVLFLFLTTFMYSV